MKEKWFLGPSITGAGELNEPLGIAVDSLNNVYVVDTVYGRVQKFTSDGKLLTKWGSVGRGDGEFNSPSGIAIDSSDIVYIADSSNHRIQKFTNDGKFIAKWGSKG
ncbi:MAG: 6-bladed beta-propeller, partial [Nitrososphaerales archaeon]